MPSVIPGPKSQPFYFFATLFLIVAILSLAKTVLIPVALAILLTFLLTPLVRRLQRRGFKRIPAVVIVTIGALIVLGSLTWAISMQIVGFVQELPKLQKVFVPKFRALLQPGAGGVQETVQEAFNAALSGKQTDPQRVVIARSFAGVVGTAGVTSGLTPLDVSVRVMATRKSFLMQRFANARAPNQGPVAAIDPGSAFRFFAATVQEAIRLVASIGVIIVLVIVMLICREEMRDRFIRLTGDARLTVTTRALDEASRRISEYMLRKLIVNAIFGAVVAMALFLIGVRFSLMWGFLLVILRFIPGLGIWLSALPPLIVGFLSLPTWQPVLLAAAVFAVGELVLINVVEPRHVGAQIGLFPVAAMVSLTFWTWLWGFVGLFLAIPLTMCLAVLGKYVPQLSFLSVLLSDQPAMDVTLRYYQRLLANDQDEAMEIANDFTENRGVAAAFDDLMAPALGYARRDVFRGELTEQDLDFFFRATREMLDDLPIPESENQTPRQNSHSDDDYKLAGAPVADTADELVLRMISSQLRRNNRRLELCPSYKLSSEIVAWAAEYEPNVIVVASIAPGQLSQTRIVCKRLRQRCSDLKIVVVRLGELNDFAKDKKGIVQSGADAVCQSIEEARLAVLNSLKQLDYARVKEEADDEKN